MSASHDHSDPIRLLEALYDLERPRDIWFRAVLETAGSVFDRGEGVGMLLYDVSGSVPRVDAMAGFNVDPDNVKVGADTHMQPGWESGIVECYRNVICGTLDEHVPDLEVRKTLRALYEPMGIRDQILINGADRSGVGCALYVFSRVRIRMSALERKLLTRIATHLSTAYRLQRRLQQTSSGEAAVVADAVLSVHGQLEHAEAAARSTESRRSLKDAVKLREWARTLAARRDPERATGAWKPLVIGRWSLVDCYERDGRRYITACENEPAPTGVGVLSPRERQVASLAELGRSNKVIAYELGLVDSTVRVLMARAASKLGVHTRSELISKLRSLQQIASPVGAE